MADTIKSSSTGYIVYEAKTDAVSDFKIEIPDVSSTAFTKANIDAVNTAAGDNFWMMKDGHSVLNITHDYAGGYREDKTVLYVDIS